MKKYPYWGWITRPFTLSNPSSTVYACSRSRKADTSVKPQKFDSASLPPGSGFYGPEYDNMASWHICRHWHPGVLLYNTEKIKRSIRWSLSVYDFMIEGNVSNERQKINPKKFKITIYFINFLSKRFPFDTMIGYWIKILKSIIVRIIDF